MDSVIEPVKCEHILILHPHGLDEEYPQADNAPGRLGHDVMTVSERVAAQFPAQVLDGRHLDFGERPARERFEQQARYAFFVVFPDEPDGNVIRLSF
jgi:hypothetical protein